MTGATTAVHAAEQHPFDVANDDVPTSPTDSSDEQPFDMIPQSSQRLQQQQQQRTVMRVQSPTAEELEDGELPSLKSKQQQQPGATTMGGRIVNGQRTTTRPLNPPNPAGLRKEPAPREQRQFWGQMDDSDEDDDYDMPEDERMLGMSGGAAPSKQQRRGSNSRRRRRRQHVEREREIDNMSRQDDEYDDADSSLGHTTYITQETSVDLTDNFCDNTLTALSDAICGTTGGIASGQQKRRGSSGSGQRKLHLPEHVDEQEEHTAIEVEFVEPASTGDMSPQRKNAYLTAMARKAKIDFRRKKNTTTTPAGEPTTSEEGAENNNIAVVPGDSAESTSDDVYHALSASEKRKFLKMINSGVVPAQATQEIFAERERVRSNNASADEPQLVKRPGPEEDDGIDGPGSKDKPGGSPRTPRLAFWKNGRNSNKKGTTGEQLDPTHPESEDSDEANFAKSGINYYDGVRRELAEDESFDVPEQTNNKTPKQPKSPRVKSPVGFAALRDRRAKSAPRPSQSNKASSNTPGAGTPQSTKSRSTRELESMVAGTLAAGAATAATVPLMQAAGEDTDDDDDAAYLSSQEHHHDDDAAYLSSQEHHHSEEEDKETPSPQPRSPVKVLDDAAAAAAADTTPQAGSARRKVSDLLTASKKKGEEGGRRSPTAAMQQIERELLAGPRAPLPQMNSSATKRHHKQKVQVEGPVDVSMDTYLNATSSYSGAKNTSTNTLPGNDNASVYTSGTGVTGVTTGSTYTQSSRVRRPGAAKSRLAKARQAETNSSAMGKGWHESIRAAAASANQVWEPDGGWVSYEEPKLETPAPSNMSMEKIHIDLDRSINKSHKLSSSSFEQQPGEDRSAPSVTTPVPFPSEWEKERSEMIERSAANIRATVVDTGAASHGHYEEKKFEPLSLAHAQEVAVQGASIREQSSSGPSGWLESMKAATAALSKEGRTDGQTWDPEHGWTRPGENKGTVSDYVDLDTPTASAERSSDVQVAETNALPTNTSPDSFRIVARAASEGELPVQQRSLPPSPEDDQKKESLVQRPPAASLPPSPADVKEKSSPLPPPHPPVAPSSSQKSTDKKLNQWIAKAEQEPRKQSEQSTESSARAVASAGADAYVQLGDNGSVHPHARTTILKPSPQSKPIIGKANTVASSYISTEDDDTEVDSAPLLSAAGAFPTINDRPISPVVDIVKEKVGAEEMGLFPQEAPKPKRVTGAAATAFPQGDIHQEKPVEVSLDQQGSSSIRSSPGRRRGGGPIDTDEVDDTWDSDDEQRSSVGWQSQTSWLAAESRTEPKPLSKSVDKKSYMQKTVPKLQGSRKDTSPVSRKTPAKQRPAAVTPSPDQASENRTGDHQRAVSEPRHRVSGSQEVGEAPPSPSVKLIRTGRWEAGQVILGSRSQDEDERPISPTVKSIRGRYEAKSGQVILDDLNSAADSLQEKPKEEKSAPGQAEWKSFLGKKVQAESAAAASSQQGKNERENRHSPERPGREANDSDDDTLFEFERRAAGSSIAGGSGTFKSDLSPIRPRGEEYEKAASEAYGPAEGDRGNFFKRLSECAAPVMPSSAPCAHTSQVEDKEEDYSNSVQQRSKSAPRPSRSQSHEVRSPGSVVSVEDFGAKTAYLEAIAMKAAVSKPRNSSRKRSSNGSVVSSTSSVHSEKWQAFLERKKASGGPISSRSSNVSEVSKAAEKYASEKVEELMSNMSRSQSDPRGTRESANAKQRAESVKAAEDLAAARVEAMMAALSNSQLDEGEI